ncbi:MAG: efflux RND transporter periplasmic adaptor subunit [Acetobacteraceae bacterium]|nr:efflux RND transporter periplasmic adaptor subunit [Acetobacteraceae bacterium]
MAPALAQPAPPAPASPAVPVSAAPVVRQDVPILLRGLGSVQAFNAVQIRPRVDGTLTQVPVAEGQEVKQGDLLAVIDPRPYQATLDAASAKKAQDEALLSSAMADLARYTALTKQEVASRQKLEEVVALAKQLRAAIVGDGAQIEAAQLNLSFCYITAPFDGRVGLRLVDPGNQVRSAEATAIMTVAQLRPISVTFALAQDTLPAIADAMAAGKLPVVASSSDDKIELDRGTLLTVDNAIDATTGTIKLKATFPNPKNRLWPGQFVNVRMLIGTDRNALTVPSAAVQHGPGNLYVYAIKPDATVTRQTVTLMRDDGKLSVLGGGVEPGQQVVIDGQSRLQDGSHVAINDTTKTASSQARPGS